ncbi:hypothetical protein MAR_020207 [Mya arenaria]|uniref:Endonuclease/exonuclease/phosphatase domain-containing protein n=1 Tax=Mya arenaria TaxID=6604 RepID=A0ABY7E7V1_MYAAR|nr:hypothetical protein MAR_020207 [Mya arenaria]
MHFVKSFDCKTLKFVLLNVCGIISKLCFPDFDKFMLKCDIFCLTETKLDDFDNVDVSVFKFQGVHRIGGLKKFGGIGFFVKDYLWKYVKFVNCNNENCLWFEIDSKLSNEKCMFGVIYIPPESFVYSFVDIFDKLESDIIDFKAEGYSICLLGDFNARTVHLSDFVSVDDFDYQTQCEFRNNLEVLGFVTDRHSEDSVCNKYGYRFSKRCKPLDVHILNLLMFTLLGSDVFIGKTTCKNVSVIDYLVFSPCLFPKIDKFDILPFDPLLSDVHDPISFDFICNSQVHIGHSCSNVKTENNRAPIYMW